MNFFKALFGSKPKTPEEDKKETEEHNFDVLKYDGKQAMMQGNTEYAVKCLTHALKIKDDPETRDYLSQALIRQGDLLMAYEHLQKLAETEPDNVKIYIRMANVAYMMEDYNAMSNACEKAMLVDKDMPELMYLYAQACIGLKDSSNAVAMLTKAINLREDYGDAYLLRGETLLADGKLDDAAEDVDAAGILSVAAADGGLASELIEVRAVVILNIELAGPRGLAVNGEAASRRDLDAADEPELFAVLEDQLDVSLDLNPLGDSLAVLIPAAYIQAVLNIPAVRRAFIRPEQGIAAQDLALPVSHAVAVFVDKGIAARLA
jgi:tetratricopeptide (TPR) repeat protein